MMVFLTVESNIVDESCLTLRHHGSVWGYGRVSDCLLHLGRLLLLAAIFHNVDGAHGNEPSDTASSAFDGLGELNELVGCRMKGATKAHAAHSLKLLGVQLDASTDVAVIAPTSKRKTKLANFFSKHIDAGKLSPSDAGSFAGKAGFFNTTGLGYAGRAAMKPSLHDSMHSCISGRPLRKHLSRRSKHYTASRCMRVHELFLLFTTHHPVPLVCAGAYFQLGGVRCNATDLSNNKVSIRPEGDSNLKNDLPAEHQKFYAELKVPTTYSGSSIRG